MKSISTSRRTITVLVNNKWLKRKKQYPPGLFKYPDVDEEIKVEIGIDISIENSDKKPEPAGKGFFNTLRSQDKSI